MKSPLKLIRFLGLSCLVATTAAVPGSVVGLDLQAAELANGSVQGTVQVFRGRSGRRLKKDLGGVVVFIEDVPGDDLEPPEKSHRIGQKEKTFTPGVSAIVKGTTVAFPNDDKVFHNVFSVSRAARFDLGLYRAGASKSVDFKRKGVVDVYCNIHPDMVAKVLVLDTSYFDQTGKDGRFEIPEVPPGTYKIKAWQSNGDEYSGSVTVEPSKASQLNIELVQKRGRDEHLRKDGTPYGRYQ